MAWWNTAAPGMEITMMRELKRNPKYCDPTRAIPKMGKVYIFAGIGDCTPPIPHPYPFILVTGFYPLHFRADLWRPVEYETDEEFLRNSEAPPLDLLEIAQRFKELRRARSL